MTAGGSRMLKEAKLSATVVAALLILLVLGLALSAKLAGAAPCDPIKDPNCDPGDPINTAPTITVDHPSVTVNQGQEATNSGTFSDQQDDPVAIKATDVGSGQDIGLVTKDDFNGIWSWKYTPDSPQERTVKITASDAGLSSSKTFALNVAPSVSSVQPADRAKGVRRNTNVTAIFSEAMDPATLNNSTVTLVKNGSTTPVTATVTLSSDGETITLDPSLRLGKRKTYTATVKGGASGAKDLAGNPLATDKVWSFTTGRR